VSDSAEGWCAAGNLRASRVSIRMDDRTDGQREDDGTDDGTHGLWDGWRDARIQGRLHFSSRRPLLYVICTGFFTLTGTFISAVLLSNCDKHILFKHVKLVLLDMVSAVMHPTNKGFDKCGWRV
jgi:hypothetical protein